jgi:hypothetical protein
MDEDLTEMETHPVPELWGRILHLIHYHGG